MTQEDFEERQWDVGSRNVARENHDRDGSEGGVEV